MRIKKQQFFNINCSYYQTAFNKQSIYQLRINPINQSNESSTVYKYRPTSFNGTLSEVAEGTILNYVKDLGFNAILITTIYSKYSVDPIYGTDAILKKKNNRKSSFSWSLCFFGASHMIFIRKISME